MSKKTAETKTDAEVKAEAKVEVKTAVPAKKQDESLMYLGPSITGVIRHAEVYAGGLPEAVQECVSEYPAMQRLFVSLDGIVDAQKQLRKETSALGAIYAQTAQKFRGR